MTNVVLINLIRTLSRQHLGTCSSFAPRTILALSRAISLVCMDRASRINANGNDQCRIERYIETSGNEATISA